MKLKAERSGFDIDAPKCSIRPMAYSWSFADTLYAFADKADFGLKKIVV